MHFTGFKLSKRTEHINVASWTKMTRGGKTASFHKRKVNRFYLALILLREMITHVDNGII